MFDTKEEWIKLYQFGQVSYIANKCSFLLVWEMIKSALNSNAY